MRFFFGEDEATKKAREAKEAADLAVKQTADAIKVNSERAAEQVKDAQARKHKIQQQLQDVKDRRAQEVKFSQDKIETANGKLRAENKKSVLLNLAHDNPRVMKKDTNLASGSRDRSEVLAIREKMLNAAPYHLKKGLGLWKKTKPQTIHVDPVPSATPVLV